MSWKIEKITKTQIARYKGRLGSFVTLEHLCLLSGASEKMLRRMVSLGLLEDNGQEKFKIDMIHKIKKIQRLHYDLGIGLNSMPLVLELLARIEELEKKINRNN